MKLTKLVSGLYKFFIPSIIEKIARETGFMKRHSKLLPETFAKAITLGLLDVKNITEEVILQKCSLIQNGLHLSKQAIKDRLEQSGPFLKALLNEAFEYIYRSLMKSYSSSLLHFFSDVKLLDATTVSLPDQVKDTYPGMGGKNADAALKLQVIYSATNHVITQLDITTGVSHDANYLDKVVETLKENELILADLGYYSYSFFEKISEKNFFISRVKSNVLFYECKSEKYDIYDPINLTEMLNTEANEIDTYVYIGSSSNKKLKVRLVGAKLPDAVAGLRIKKAIAQNKGLDISKEKRIFLHWNLMITNVPAETLGSKVILEIYRLRWQIEILFKVLKSSLSIDKMHIGKVEYVDALLYGRLIGTLLTMPLYACMDESMLRNKGRGVSIQRFYTLLLVEIHNFYSARKITVHLILELAETIKNIALTALHEKRKRKTTFMQIESYLEEYLSNGKT